jgi:uncharacterized membrane protein SpoIIM required for sporulation
MPLVACLRDSWRRFGTVALMLQLIPLFSMFFLLTTAAGSAIWVSEIEKRKQYLADHRNEIEESGYRDDPT